MDQYKIKTFVEQLLKSSGDTKPVMSNESLILSNRLDSISIAELIMFLEDECEINISTSDSNFYKKIDTIDNIHNHITNSK